MAQTDFATFSDLARQGNLIPVYREILGDWRPRYLPIRS